MKRYLIRFEDGSASMIEAGRVISFEDRAHQYLAEQAIDVLHADSEHVAALCRGYSKSYSMGYDEDRGWWCSCRIKDECPHLMALRMVVASTPDSNRTPEALTELAEVRQRVMETIRHETEFVNLRQRAERSAQLESELTALRERASRVSELQAELSEKTARLDRIEAELHEIRPEAARAAKLDQALTDRDAKIDRLEAKVRELKPEAARAVQLDKSLEVQRARQARLESQIKAGDAQRQQMENEIRTLRERAARASVLERVVTERDHRLSSLETEVARLRREAVRAVELDGVVARQNVWVRQLEAKLARQVNRLSQLEMELTERDIVANQARTQLEALRARARVLSPPTAGAPVPARRPAPAPRHAVETTGESALWMDRAMPDLAHRNGRRVEWSGRAAAHRVTRSGAARHRIPGLNVAAPCCQAAAPPAGNFAEPVRRSSGESVVRRGQLVSGPDRQRLGGRGVRGRCRAVRAQASPAPVSDAFPVTAALCAACGR